MTKHIDPKHINATNFDNVGSEDKPRITDKEIFDGREIEEVKLRLKAQRQPLNDYAAKVIEHLQARNRELVENKRVWYADHGRWYIRNNNLRKRASPRRRGGIIMDSEMIKWQLEELSAFDSDDIESNEFDIYGEDEHGYEGSFSVKITEIASKALSRIDALEKALKDIAIVYTPNGNLGKDIKKALDGAGE